MIHERPNPNGRFTPSASAERSGLVAVRRLLISAFALALSPAVATTDAQTVQAAALRAAAAHAQPGDRVFVHIVGEPTLSDTVTVNERGEVALPKLGVVNIAPFTISALQDTIRSRYAVFLREPAVE